MKKIVSLKTLVDTPEVQVEELGFINNETAGKKVINEAKRALTLAPAEQAKTLVQLITNLKTEYFTPKYTWKNVTEKYIDKNIKAPIYDSAKAIMENHLITLSAKEELMQILLSELRPIQGHMDNTSTAKFCDLLTFAGGMKPEISTVALDLLMSIQKTFRNTSRYHKNLDKFKRFALHSEKTEIDHKSYREVKNKVMADAKKILQLDPKVQRNAFHDLISNLESQIFVFRHHWNTTIQEYIDKYLKADLLEFSKDFFKNHLIPLKDKETLMLDIIDHLEPIQGKMDYFHSSPITKFAEVLVFASGMREEVSSKALELLLSIKYSNTHKKKYLNLIKQFYRYATASQRAEIDSKLKL